MGRIAAFITAAIVSGCATTAPKARPYNAQLMEPEGWYETVYDEVHECLDRFGLVREDASYDNIVWLVYPTGAIPDIVGLWSSPNNIYFDAQFVFNRRVVRHEIGHYIIGPNHGDHHLRLEFKICIVEESKPN